MPLPPTQGIIQREGIGATQMRHYVMLSSGQKRVYGLEKMGNLLWDKSVASVHNAETDSCAGPIINAKRLSP